MRRFLAARVGAAAACVIAFLLGSSVVVRPAGAQTWNDPRSRSLVERATQRRAEQLADTALRDYQAVAHGYVAFLAQLGEGFRTPPKVIKTDELEDEVYWKAPNLSKQRIVGRRDTLLLPTDISYHSDHLGIVQNNFPDIIRIGDGGDEVADVPHPLSRVGLQAYDFALADSFSIGAGAQRIQVYEVRVRPKDDTKPRVVGAVYIDQASSQVVRMNLTFTRAAFLDKALEDLSLVLENRLVGGRFWLPSRQEVEIRRRGEWLDYPARGIIRGRWEIGSYQFNQSLAPVLFTGPEVIQAPPQVLAQHHWEGNILDSLPADLRAIQEEDIARVQEEARAMVRAQALATAKHATLSARKISDFVRFDRVEGLSLGGGLQKQLGGGVAVTGRGRYGLDDKTGKYGVDLSVDSPADGTLHLFAERDLKDVGDFAERSSVLNSIAAQEFGSDYTDAFFRRTVGARYDFLPISDFDLRLTGAYDWESPAGVHALPVTGHFEPTIAFESRRAMRLSVELERPLMPWRFGTDASLHSEVTLHDPVVESTPGTPPGDGRSIRGFLMGQVERPLGAMRLVTSASVAGVSVTSKTEAQYPMTELVYLGGPVSAPGYDYHQLIAKMGYTAHVELRLPAPFPAFSLGRYGKVPARATFAPYLHVAGVGHPLSVCGVATVGVSGTCPQDAHLFPSVGAAYLLPFDILRLDVARGTGPGGRWTFGIDVLRDFWSIL